MVLLTNKTERVCLCNQYLFDVNAEVIECLPNGYVKIHITVTNPMVTGEFTDDNLKGYCLGYYNGSVKNGGDFTFITPFAEACDIMEMPGYFHQYYIDKNLSIPIMCNIHVFDDHREVDLYEVESFETIYRFIRFCSDKTRHASALYDITDINDNVDMRMDDDHYVLTEYVTYDQTGEELSEIHLGSNIGDNGHYTSHCSVTIDENVCKTNLPITRYEFHTKDGQTISVLLAEGLENVY